jgi:hypothetical protein
MVKFDHGAGDLEPVCGDGRQHRLAGNFSSPMNVVGERPGVVGAAFQGEIGVARGNKLDQWRGRELGCEVVVVRVKSHPQESGLTSLA